MFFARESLEIQPDGTRSEKGGDTFPEHNFENIIKVILEKIQYDLYVFRIPNLIKCVYCYRLRVCVCACVSSCSTWHYVQHCVQGFTVMESCY